METLQQSKIKLPFVWDVIESEPDSFISFYKKNAGEIEKKLSTFGAIKFKNVQIASTGSFQHIVNSVSSNFMNYVDGNSPRTKLGENVYTSTEYDKMQKITMHNELSYSAKWPNKLFFSCLQPATTGGETLLADSREVLRQIDDSIVRQIRTHGITYIRNLHGGGGIGPSWQDTFDTTDKAQLEKNCKAYEIDFTWRADGAIQLRQHSKGIIRHRSTHEEVWFNQIDQFHPYHLGEEMYDVLKVTYDTPEDYPMWVQYGNRAPIGDDVIKHVLEQVDKVTYAPRWERNELLVVDNELASHGRNSYTGERKVLVAMSA
ncbi:MAG: TauD/TfdA family dioxygenase [Chryseotalea sp. WA131a]|nr:MAG: TauD/TfdA family dioxygenase [Chryseotalea sp. WA131a]